MDLGIFSTQVTGQNKGPLAGGTNPLLGNGNIGGLGNLNFLETILGNLNAKDDAKVKTSNENNNTVTDSSIKNETSDLALLKLALLGQDPDQSLDEKLAALKIEELAQTEGNRVDQLTKMINHLTSGLPQEIGDESQIADLVARLNSRLEKLEASLEAFRNNDFSTQDAPFKLLIATGLNPAQLTNITSRIEEVEAKLGRELTVEDLIAGVGNIIPAPGDEDHEFATTDALSLMIQKSQEHKEEQAALDNSQLPFASQNIGDNAATKNGAVRNFDMQSILNLIAANKIQPAGAQGNIGGNTSGAVVDDNTTTLIPEDGITPLPTNLSNSEFKELFGSNNNVNIGSKSNIANLVTANMTPDSALPKMGVLGDLLIPASFNDGATLSQQALSDALGFDIQTGTPFTQTMQAAHVATTTSVSAGQQHPATSMVAAKISKAAQSGETRQMTLQLDPPELGRVEVRMEFGADKQVKAHLIVEKPETLLMLQRDQAALERALQDAGMDTGSDSLDFQMAEENYGFGDDNGRNGNSGTKNARDNTDEDELEIIETNMNWNVDPDTGHVHYNILA